MIADDYPLMLAGLGSAIEQSAGIEVAAEARSAPELLAMVELHHPDLVLMDVRLPGAAATSLIERVRQAWPAIRVLALTAPDDHPSAELALAAGATGIVGRNAHPSDLGAILWSAASGGSPHAPSARQDPAAGLPAPEDVALTPRERTILKEVAAGLTTAAISRDLWISEHTIKFHLTNIYRKIGVSNRAAAVRYALEQGLAFS